MSRHLLLLAVPGQVPETAAVEASTLVGATQKLAAISGRMLAAAIPIQKTVGPHHAKEPESLAGWAAGHWGADPVLDYGWWS